MLKGKNIVIGVTGSIAAYKIADLVSMLVKLEANVQVIMTENATKFIHPVTFETLTSNQCYLDTFEKSNDYKVKHIALAKEADVFMIAPASANIIGKIANGIADDMLSTTILAISDGKCPILIAPAMNTNMYLNRVVQSNLKKLRDFGMEIIQPATGFLACKDTGMGKLPSQATLLEHIKAAVMPKDLKGKKVLITAGATREKIDPVRFLSNPSTGKMGYELARVCAYRGAEVVLVSANSQEQVPIGVTPIFVTSAKDMAEQVKKYYQEQHIIIKAAAVSDYTPIVVYADKLKKQDGNLNLELERTEDILKYLGEHKKKHQFICGFSMETTNLVENSRSKLTNKKADMIVANNLTQSGAGFAGDTNIVTIITPSSFTEFSQMSKYDTAVTIMDEIIKEMKAREYINELL